MKFSTNPRFTAGILFCCYDLTCEYPRAGSSSRADLHP